MINTLYEFYIKTGYKICTDSRNIIPDSIFFALKGENFDGNKYAIEAINKGASLAVIDNPEFKTDKTLIVKNTLTALQQLALLHRRKSNFKVFALTGTNGKTTTKELIKNVLSDKYNCYATSGNLNNHIGVPITILSTPVDAEILVVEMGANHMGEIDLLCNIAEPDLGLITNIGKAHLDGFGSFNGVIKAKSELYRYLIKNNRPIFINVNDKLLLSLINDYSNIKTYGTEASDCWVSSINFDNGLSITINLKNETFAIKTKMFGKYNISNILAAAKTGSFFGVDAAKIANALEEYVPDNNRSQITKTQFNTLILDSYNANPTSMQAALESFSEIKFDNKVVILGEMKELGKNSPEEHRKLIYLIRSFNIGQCFLLGKEFKHIDLDSEKYFETNEELINYLKTKPILNSLVILKGSRSNKLEKMQKYL